RLPLEYHRHQRESDQPATDFARVAERDAQASENGNHTRQRDQQPRGRPPRLGGVSDVSRGEMPEYRHQEAGGIEESTEGNEVDHGKPLSVVRERIRTSA